MWSAAALPDPKREARMAGRVVVFGSGMECESPGPMDWVERGDTRKEFESGDRQQPVFDSAAVAGTASGLSHVGFGDAAIEKGLEGPLRI